MTARYNRLPTERLAPVGRCIYCIKSEAEVKLEEEHIFPLGIGGNVIIPNASCRVCAKRTGRMEHTCLREMFGPLRIALGLPTRRPKERPTHLTITVWRRGASEEISIPIKEIPYFLYLPCFNLPALLTGLEPIGNWQEPIQVWAKGLTRDADGFLSRLDADMVKLPGQVRSFEFARFIAKIAHAHAVAVYGLGSFEPLLPGLVLGKTELAPYLVGGGLSDFPPPPKNAQHAVETVWVDAPGGIFLVSFVSLFSNLQAPVYKAVVGRPIA